MQGVQILAPWCDARADARGATHIADRLPLRWRFQPVRWQPGSPLAIWAQGVQLGSLPATLTESTRLTGLPGPHTRSWAACNKSQPDISGGADRTPTDRLVSFWAQPGSAKQPEAPA